MESTYKKTTLGKGGIDVTESEKEEGAWTVSCRRTRRKGQGGGSGSESDTSVVSAVSAVSAASEKRKRRKAFLKDSSSSDEKTVRKKKREEKTPAPPKRTRARADTLPQPEEIRGELAFLPTAEIGAEITRQTDEIERVAKTSGNLKGTYVRQLKLAARTVKTAATELALRTQADTEIRQIRAENLDLKEQVRLLREEVLKLRATVPHEGNLPSSTPPAGGTAAIAPLSDRCGRVSEASHSTLAVTAQPPATLPAGEELLARIGRMVDAKLEALRADLTTGPVSRPPLQHERNAEAAAAKERKNLEGKGKEKEKKKVEKQREERNKRETGKDKRVKDSCTAAASTSTAPVESEAVRATDTWAKVVGRKKKTAAQNAAPPKAPAATSSSKKAPNNPEKPGKKPNPGKAPKVKGVKEGLGQENKQGSGGSKPRIPRPLGLRR